jgi:hypothetical protein
MIIVADRLVMIPAGIDDREHDVTRLQGRRQAIVEATPLAERKLVDLCCITMDACHPIASSLHCIKLTKTLFMLIF